MEYVGNGSHQLIPGDMFDAHFCHHDISLVNDSRSAVVEVVDIDPTHCVMGRNIYSFGGNNIYIRLDNLPDYFIAWIGMTCNPDPPLDNVHSQESFIGWRVHSSSFIDNRGEVDEYNDLGKPWISGDVIHLHLDCALRVLTVHHMRSGKTHSIETSVGEQRLFIALGELGTAVSFVNN